MAFHWRQSGWNMKSICCCIKVVYLHTDSHRWSNARGISVNFIFEQLIECSREISMVLGNQPSCRNAFWVFIIRVEIRLHKYASWTTVSRRMGHYLLQRAGKTKKKQLFQIQPLTMCDGWVFSFNVDIEQSVSKIRSVRALGLHFLRWEMKLLIFLIFIFKI